MQRFRSCVLTLAVMIFSHAAFGVDGIILIDQNRALAGNVTPGDAPGFPVTISLPGSFRLSGNLTPPAVNTNAIDITSSSVTLDLNGFRAQCSYSQEIPGAACVGGGFANLNNIEIRNGTVSNAGGFGIGIWFLFSPGVAIENLRISGGGASFVLGVSSRIKNVIVLTGPSLQCPSLIIDSINLSGSAGGGGGCVRVNSLGVWPN